MNKLKVLVTGGLGLIGSNFIQKLLIENKDYEVINIDGDGTIDEVTQRILTATQ